jgi:hypothetical protein
MPIGKKFGTMQLNEIGPLLISHRYSSLSGLTSNESYTTVGVVRPDKIFDFRQLLECDIYRNHPWCKIR